jgi:hypothetical protein
MALIFCTGVVMALLTDPLIRSALVGLALGGVLFAVLCSVIYLISGCIVLVVRLFRRLRSREWWSMRGRATGKPSPLIGD